MRKTLGVALDIGTTTIQGKLIDLDKTKELAFFSCLNEQLSHGHDVISRLKFCLEKTNGLEKLHQNAISSINFVINNLVSLAREEKENINTISAVGNTALYHFVLSLSPEKLAKAPYEPEYKALVSKRARSLKIEVSEDCEFNFLPNIGGFVGSDAIGVILATEMDRSEVPILAVDLGTNGEIILGSRDGIMVTSAAAGPVFEGWHISCGMRAVKGAIESIEDMGESLSFGVIGGGEPRGISGSGIVDLIAILLKREMINRSGKMDGEFIVYEGHKKISITQEDVREIQLAKAAFSVGVNYLRRHVDKDISKFVVTGNFGKRLNKENAKIIGIVPDDARLEDVEFLENGALMGAQMFVNNKLAAASRIKDIINITKHVPLGQDSSFQRMFAEATRFNYMVNTY